MLGNHSAQYGQPYYPQDHNQVIELLEYLYPKAFFVNPRCRLPLKLGIEKDIDPKEIEQAAGHPVNVHGAVGWYTGHYGYLLQIQTGAPRYNLHGERVGTVVQDEAIAAEARVRELNKIKKERQMELAEARVRELNRIKNERRMERMHNENGHELPGFITKAPAVKEPPPLITKPAVENERAKQLKLAIKRIDLAASNLEDGEMAATILRNASDVIEQVINKITGNEKEDTSA
jgi:sRNA-binding protein